MTERDALERAFGGHPPTVKAVREHLKWHEETDGKAAVCWKEAEYVRWLLQQAKSE